MQLEVGKTYKTRNGRTVRVGHIENGLAACAIIDVQGNPITYNADTGLPISCSGAYDIVGQAEPELMFSFRRPGPEHSITVSEGRLRKYIEDTRTYGGFEVIADAAERMIELTKTRPPRPKLEIGAGALPIRKQLTYLLEVVGLDPDGFLRKPADHVTYTKEPSNVMCKPEPTSTVESTQAARQLAEMLEADLDIKIHSGVLRLYLIARWDKISQFAHRIHSSA